MKQAEALARLRLARGEGIGPLTFRRLLQRFGSAEAAIGALSRHPDRFRPIEPAEAAREWEATQRLGGRFLFHGEAGYPPLLATIPDAPPVLSCLGYEEAFAPKAVAIVGARNATLAGRRFAEILARDLAREGLCIVSGLARGIDAAAHEGAITGAGPTIAAMAGGLDKPYPPENAPLQARILERGGAVITEAPLGTAPLARHFPRRNRLVAGLSLGVVIVEAMAKSGTLITARLGLEYGREIFAVPGHPLEPRARGPNDLLRQGARLTETAADVLEHLPDAPADTPLFTPRNMPAEAEEAPPDPVGPAPDALQILDLLGTDAVSVDDLARRCQLSVPELRAILLDLELEGRVQTLSGNRVARA
ncbi:DNA-processing protein DprA [Rhodovarius lipocyclicus]|uniref:DNA-processing protein DprA n=1 Tax=Rhodovarius lipocyclicus TaxID=268410 RepID=UPI001359FE24|nr:DNA-processing protein DprA [Rhodovarius lipocyclicus]